MSLNTTVPANITENNYSVPSFPSDAGLNTSVPAVVGDNYAVPSLPIENLSGKEDKSNKGIANGYAPLDATSKVPSGNLPTNLALTSDSRFTDSRTPTAHTHAIADVTSLQTTLDDAIYSSVIGPNLDKDVDFTQTGGGDNSEIGAWGFGVADGSGTSASIEPIGVTLDNSAKLRKGTTDAGDGGNKGIGLECSAQYELKWEAGRLYTMQQNGTTIRSVEHCMSVPNFNDDETKGYVVGTRWVMDSGKTYVCTDATEATAIWQLKFSQENSDDGAGGTIDLSADLGNGGSIDLSGGASGETGGSIISTCSDGLGGYCGTLNMSAVGGQSGGSISTYATGFGAGGSIDTTDVGGSIDTHGYGGSINTSLSGGSINTSGGANGGGSINTSGGSNGAGGSIDTSAGTDGGGGSINTSDVGGSINTSDGGGSINTSGNNGGSIDTSGYQSGIPLHAGGSINTSGGVNDIGGAINTSNGGGSINTQGVGSIGLGVAETRTTLNGSATTEQTITLPDETGTIALTSDSRFTDARTPASHTHGSITNAGAVGSTANLPLITTTSGVVTTGTFGTTSNSFCQGNDSRLSDSRTPTAHTHAMSDVTSLQATLIAFAIALG